METFTHTIKDPLGIHARPAGALAKEARKFGSKITISKGEQQAEASKLIAVMSLGIKCGDQITIAVEGTDESAAAKAIQDFLARTL